MSPKSSSQLLQEARALIATGWCQKYWHTIRDGRDCYCTGGAMLRALGSVVPLNTMTCDAGDRLYYSPVMRILDRVARRLDPDCESAIHYNEMRRRTQAEVLALFDAALTEVTK